MSRRDRPRGGEVVVQAEILVPRFDAYATDTVADE